MKWLYILFLFSFAVAAPPVYLPPTKDPFYLLPDGFEDAKLGEILKSRPIPYQLRGAIFPIQVESTWQLLVRSTDSHGNATAVVTTIIKPFNADPSKFVTFQSAPDSSAVDCAISWSIQVPSGEFATLLVQADMTVVTAQLEEGWYVVLTDYAGLDSAFTAAILGAHATLDGLRAALSSQNITGLDPDAKTIFYGYSAGALVTGFAASMQPAYAPELKPHLLGAAMGGFVANITASVVAIQGTPFVGLTSAGINGLIKEYPELVPIVEREIMSPDKYDQLKWTNTQCLVPTLLHYAFEDFFTGDSRYFKSGWDFLRIPEVENVLNINTLAFDKAGPVPEIPVFVFQGKHDEVAVYVEVKRVFDNWREGGIESFEFNVDNTGSHVTEFVFGAPAALTWMKGRFNGTEAIKGCVETDNWINLEVPGSIHSLSYLLDSIAGSWMQEPLGPDNSSTTKRLQIYTPIHELKRRALLGRNE